jgi:small subunit ribosomal protein S18
MSETTTTSPVAAAAAPSTGGGGGSQQRDPLPHADLHRDHQGEVLTASRSTGITYIDYKDADFLLRLVNEQGKILPRRLTGTSLKFQKRVAQAVKRSRHLALMPYVADMLK